MIKQQFGIAGRNRGHSMFSLPAFTNKVGDHYQTGEREVSLIGSTGDRPPSQGGHGWQPYDVRKLVTVPIDFSGKPPHKKGDRKSMMDYWRSVRKVQMDVPYKVHHKWINPVDGVTSSYDYEETNYLSINHGPFGFVPYNWEVIENSYAESQVKALNRLSEQKAQLWADFAQAKQAVDMFADTAHRGADFLLALKRGQFSRIPRILGFGKPRPGHKPKSIADYWLEYQYGWKPLVGSIEDTYNVATAALENNQMISAKGFSKFKHGSSFAYGDTLQKYESEGSILTYLQARVSSAFLTRMSQYGVINPATVAWELVPWSFAVDWFIPVGATLEAMSATVGLDFVRGEHSRHLKYRLNITKKTGSQGQFSNAVVTDGGFYEEHGYDFDRDALSAFPASEYYADSTPFSTPRVLNAIALVRQLLK